MSSSECPEKILKSFSLTITGKLMVFSILSRGDSCSSLSGNDTSFTQSFHLKTNHWPISWEFTVAILKYLYNFPPVILREGNNLFLVFKCPALNCMKVRFLSDYKSTVSWNHCFTCGHGTTQTLPSQSFTPALKGEMNLPTRVWK